MTRNKRLLGTNYYSVSQWSGTNPLGLKATLALITSQGNLYASIITLTDYIGCGSDHDINVPSNTTITGGGDTYGVNGQTIYTSPPIGTYLFVVSGENVTFERLKLRGPWIYCDANASVSQVSGIFFLEGANNGLVQFCDVCGFPGAAICFKSTNNVVYGNNIHNNFMIYTNPSGDSETMGYGVLVSDAGQAVIHHNYFNNNQHAIAGGGSDNKYPSL